MRILRTIESFPPAITGPSNQAYEISSRLERRGIASPVLTTYMDVDPGLPAKETLNGVRVTRLPVRFRVMRYAVTPGQCLHMRRYDLVHSHNYRNFQTDCAFFLPG